MSYIEILVLSHLAGRASHGYELRQQIQATTGVALHNNSLYPALRRFEEAGAVAKRIEDRPLGGPARHVYCLTDSGRRLLHELLADLPDEQRQDDNEFLARVGQFEHLSPGERRALISIRRRALEDRLGHLNQMLARSAHRAWGGAVLQELHRRCLEELAWLEYLLTIADNGPAALEALPQ